MSITSENMNDHTKNGKWIIDTDPGVDDSFAIILALSILEDKLVALSIENGNVGIERCFINAKKICVVKNKHIPVYKGVHLNLSGVNLNAAAVHGQDGLYELEEYIEYDKKYNEKVLEPLENKDFPFIDKCSPLKIIELSHKYKGELNILAIGPLTNIAVAFMLDPTLPERLNNLVIMGGAYTSHGNIKTNVEFNFACDPISAKIVIDNFHKPNNKIVIYPWETCVKHLILKNHIELIEKYATETKEYCKKIILKKESGENENGIYADFGSAVYVIDKNTVETSIFKYVDIAIDSDVSSFGQLCLLNDFTVKKQLSTSKKFRQKVEIITKLKEDEFYKFFEKMNQE